MKQTNEQKIRNDRIQGLDGYRGLAILFVLLYHFYPHIFQGGYIGVSMLFLLSGYLMARLSQKKYRQQQFSILEFYQSKIKRIYPSLFMFVGLTGLVIYFCFRRLLLGMIPEVLSIFGGYNNFWQIQQNASYFERISNASPFTHIWSLAIEMQFYFIWPIVFIFYRWLHKKTTYANLLFIIFMIGSMLTMTLRYQPTVDVTKIYYHSFTRCGAIFLGIWIGLRSPEFWQKSLQYVSKKIIYLTFIIAIFLLLLYLFWIDGQLKFTYVFGMNGMTIILGMLLILITSEDYPFATYIDNSLFKWLGSRGYDLYLWHYAVIFFYNAFKFQPSVLGFIIQITIACLLAELTFKLATLKLTSLTRIKSLLNYNDVVSIITTIILFLSYIGLCLIVIVGISHDTTNLQLEADLAKNAQILAEQQSVSVETTVSENSMSINETTLAQTTIEPLKPTDRFTTFIGDSVLLGAVQEIQELFPNTYIEAAESRQAYEVSDLLQQMVDNGQVGDTVVIGLGTNGYFDQSFGQELIDILGSKRDIFWINIYGEFLQWEASTNAVIAELANENVNVHIIDWKEQVSQHPEWLTNDGIHPEYNGRKEYARIIYKKIEATLQ